MFEPGDIVQFYAPQTGYPKYHLCIAKASKEGAAKFLFINSKDGFAGDFTCADKEIPCIPKSKTGKSVVSCSAFVRANEKQLELYKAKKLGRLSNLVARKLEKFIQETKTSPLTKKERGEVLTALATVK